MVLLFFLSVSTALNLRNNCAYQTEQGTFCDLDVEGFAKCHQLARIGWVDATECGYPSNIRVENGSM